MNKFLEVIKANRRAIIMKTLLIGGSIVGLALAVQVMQKDKNGEDNEILEGEIIEENLQENSAM